MRVAKKNTTVNFKLGNVMNLPCFVNSEKNVEIEKLLLKSFTSLTIGDLSESQTYSKRSHIYHNSSSYSVLVIIKLHLQSRSTLGVYYKRVLNNVQISRFLKTYYTIFHRTN